MYIRQRAIHRPNSTDVAHDLINRRTCLHVDAWIYQDHHDNLLLHIEYSIAGKQLVHAETYMIAFDEYSSVQRWELRPVPTLRPTHTDMVQLTHRHIDSKWGKRKHPYLEHVHRELITPLLWRDIGQGTKGYRSIALHYIWTNPKISEPMSGIENLYGVTGYHGRYPDSSPANTLAREYEKATRLPPKERSIMRTLDKVLRNPNST